MTIKEYLFPETVEGCLMLLESGGGRYRIIAGGTDLVIWLKKGKYTPEGVVDISRINELKEILFSDGSVRLGAAVTHAEIAASSLLRARLPALAEASGSVGSPQIRNIATVAGNVVSAQPAADAAIALTALGAEMEIVSSSGRRSEPVEKLYAGVGQSRVDSTRELVAGIVIPLAGEGSGSAFMRAAPRSALALPVINSAVCLYTSGGCITGARIAVGPVAARPFRPFPAEEFLVGAALSDAGRLGRAAEIAAELSNPRDSLLRGSAGYRRHLVKIMVNRALVKAAQRAGGDCLAAN